MTQGLLEEINAPRGWGWERLWAAAPRMQEVGQPDAQPLSVFLQAGVVPRSSREDNHNQLGEDLTKYQVVQPGDIVFNKLRTWQGGLGVSAYYGIVSPAYFVCRPVSKWHARYLHYLLLSSPYLAELTRLSKFMPPSQFDIPWDMLRTLPLLRPPIEEQGRIADFLDAETARIDQLAKLRFTQMSALTSRYQSRLSLTAQALSEQYGSVKVRHVLQKIEQGWSPQCEDRLVNDGEWGVIKAGCVNGGVFDTAQHKALPATTQPELRYRLRSRDLLMSRASGSVDMIGSIAVLPDDLSTRLLLCDKVYRLQMDRTRMVPEFVAFMLRTLQVREQIKLGISGADGMANNLPTATVTNLSLPDVPIGQQGQVVNALNDAWRAVQDTTRVLKQQFSVLAERRQALITAAVTGGIAV